MKPANSPDRITELANIISTNTALVSDYLSSNNLAPLSNDEGAPAKPQIPPHEVKVIKAQDAVIAATQELSLLMLGPYENLLRMAIVNTHETLALQSAYHYKLADHVPPEGSATYAELATRSGLPETELKRLMRMGFVSGLFVQVEGKEEVKHTGLSRALKDVVGMKDIVGIMIEEMGRGAVRAVDALDKWGEAKSPEQSGYGLAHNTDKGLYSVLGENPERGTRFVSAMSAFATRSGEDSLAASFDWKAVKSVVDVGGGRGEVCLSLARRFDHLEFVVQDLEHVVEDAAMNGHEEGDESVRQRVRFADHNYFDEQKEAGMDVYYFRYIFHNLPDESCVKLLKAQIPALKQNAHILIQDAVVSEPRVDLPPWKEKYRRAMDLVMLTFFGSRERTLREWKDIVRRADERLEVNFKSTASGHECDIFDVTWKSNNEQAEQLLLER